jgi:hypothetical protein
MKPRLRNALSLARATVGRDVGIFAKALQQAFARFALPKEARGLGENGRQIATAPLGPTTQTCHASDDA